MKGYLEALFLMSKNKWDYDHTKEIDWPISFINADLKNYIITANKQYTMIIWNSFQELKNFNRKYISSIHQKKESVCTNSNNNIYIYTQNYSKTITYHQRKWYH